MTRCKEFYEKAEKDGNFCGMAKGDYQRLMAYRSLVEDNLAIAKLTEGAARNLISEPNKEVKAKAIVKIGEILATGEKVTGKEVKEILIGEGHVDKPKRAKEKDKPKELGKVEQELCNYFIRILKKTSEKGWTKDRLEPIIYKAIRDTFRGGRVK